MRMVNKALPAVLSTAMATSLCVGTFAVPVSAAESSDTKCRLTYDSQGGDPLQARTYDKGSVVDLIPQATRSGYAFLGWYNGTGANAAEVTSATMNTDKTVYARWEVSTENTLHTTSICRTRITMFRQQQAMPKLFCRSLLLQMPLRVIT